VHAAVDTLGHLLALHVTPANEQDRKQVDALAEEVGGRARLFAWPSRFRRLLLGIMNDYRKRWRGCTLSPLLASFFIGRSPSSVRVHNMF
jgi:transposase